MIWREKRKTTCVRESKMGDVEIDIREKEGMDHVGQSDEMLVEFLTLFKLQSIFNHLLETIYIFCLK